MIIIDIYAIIIFMDLKDVDDSAFENWIYERDQVVVRKNNKYKSKVPFFDSGPWRTLRAKVLDHYGSTCMKCRIGKIDGAIIQVDHIRPRSLFPRLALEFDNLQVLCKECNSAKGIITEDYRS